jgi:hypothetical protein
MGIIVTLHSLHGKPIPQWPYRLSINTFIAAFSVLIKASSGLMLAEGISYIKWTTTRPQSPQSFVIHDEASRGPWGAANLLRTDLGSVSSLGAFATLLVLLLELFSQQLVSFIDCEQVHEGKVGTIPRTRYFERSGRNFVGNLVDISWDLSKAVYEGLYATKKSQVHFVCETGNCRLLLDSLRAFLATFPSAN